MHFQHLFFLLTGCIALAQCYIEEPFHTLKVPFKIEKGGQTVEQVFLEFHCHTVLYEKNMAMKMNIVSSEEVSMAADKCGKRLFETTNDIKNATYFFNKEWIETMLTGIAQTCTVVTEYAVDFTIDCKGPCNGTIYFSLMELKPKGMLSLGERSNAMEESIVFETSPGEIPTVVSKDIRYIIDAAFMNPRLRIEHVILYSTNFTLAIGKCGLEFLKIDGTGIYKKHVLGWEETKLLRLVKSTQCPEDTSESIDYMMASQKQGSGSVTYLMSKTQKSMPHHPANDFHSMELARGVPKHHPTKKPDLTQKGNIRNIGIIPIFVILKFYI